MPIVNLGRLTSVSVSDVWRSEPHDFTPWLAHPDNLKLLCDILGIEELVDVRQEDPVGRFRVDIVAREEGGGTVVIENQFGRTDHGHLGQIMTYLAGQRGPVTVVWIAEQFNEEHRAVIDWLNANSGDDYAFFAVEVEVLKIGNSEPAPWFNVVAKPNVWSRAVRKPSDGEEGGPGSRRQKQLAYWTSFSEFLQANKSSFRIRRPRKDHWFEFPTGRSGSVISATISLDRYRRIGVELYNHGDVNKVIFDALYAQKPEIEAEIGSTLDWQRLDAKKATRIALFKTGEDPGNPEEWLQQHAWMLEQMTKFKKAFAPRLLGMQAAGVGDGGDADADADTREPDDTPE